MKRLTKIVATLSCKNATHQSIQTLLQAGMDAVRLNTAHMSLEEGKKMVDLIREVSPFTPIIIDTKGPEVRTTVADAPIPVSQGSSIELQADPRAPSTPDCLSVSYEGFTEEVPVGSEILIDDGDVSLTVVSKQHRRLQCTVNNDGIIGSRKSVNVPSVAIQVPSLSDKDLDFIQFSAQNNIDFIAHSFVRNQEDVIVIQKLIEARHSHCQIIAKIENQEGVDNIDSILEHVYGIMVARGDLGIEIPPARIPHIQKTLIQKAMQKRRAVIVATQMLHSMIQNPRPTRAEVSDVANAIYDGADAVMLSGETANGKYPIEAIRTMAEIAREANSVIPPMRHLAREIIAGPIASHLTHLAVEASADLHPAAIIADSKSGRTIRALAAYRPATPIYAFCYDPSTLKQVALFHGVQPIFTPQRDDAREFMTEAITQLVQSKAIRKEDIVVILAGNFGSDEGASFVEICEAQKRLQLPESRPPRR